MGDPIFFVISRSNSYFKIRTCVCGSFLAGFSFLLFFTCSGSTNVIRGHFGTIFSIRFDILSDLASNILPEGLLFKPEGLLSNVEYIPH